MDFGLSPVSVETIWLRTFWNYIESCVKSGRSYQPHEENNIAVLAVQIADSLCEAFKARTQYFGGSGTGQPTPIALASAYTGNSVTDALDTMFDSATPKNVTNIIDEGLNRVRTANAPTPTTLPIRPSSPRMR